MKSGPGGSFIWTILLGLIILVMVIIAHGFPTSLTFTPFLAGYGTLAMIGVLILGRYYPEILRWTETTLQDLWGGDEAVPGHGGGAEAEEIPSWPTIIRSIGYILSYLALVILFGLIVITPLFIATYLIFEARIKPLWAALAALIASMLLLAGMVLLKVDIWAGIGPEIIPDYLGGSILPPL